MKKARTRGGSPAYAIKLPTIFTFNDFCTALSEESLKEQLDFTKLKKREAMEILYSRLSWNGREGEFQGMDDIGDDTEILNEERRKARIWVTKNYPFLTEPNIKPLD